MPAKRAPVTKSETREEHVVRLRVICRKPPSPEAHGAAFGIQDNSITAAWVLHPGKTTRDGDIIFECEARVRPDTKTGAPNFLGPFVHGSAPQKFLYLSWRPASWKPGQLEATWVRRMKIHLKTISWDQINEAVKAGGIIEAAVEGTGKDGGPACASVPLIGGGWNCRDR